MFSILLYPHAAAAAGGWGGGGGGSTKHVPSGRQITHKIITADSVYLRISIEPYVQIRAYDMYAAV